MALKREQLAGRGERVLVSISMRSLKQRRCRAPTAVATLGRRVAVVVEHADRRRRADRVAVEVGEHLLAAVEPASRKKTTAMVSSPRLGFVLERQLDRGRRCWPSLMTNAADIGMREEPERARRRPSPGSGSNRTSALIDAVSAEKT